MSEDKSDSSTILYNRINTLTNPSIAHDYYAKVDEGAMTSVDVIANLYYDTFVIIPLKRSAATFDIRMIRCTIKTRTWTRPLTDDDSEADVRMVTSSLSL